MNFRSLKKGTEAEETHKRDKKTNIASRTRRIAVWGMLLLGAGTLAVSATGCSQEYKLNKEIKRKEIIKSDMEKRIKDEIDILYSTSNFNTTEMNIGAFYYRKGGEIIFPYLTLNNNLTRDSQYNISKEEMIKIIDGIAKEYPNTNFGITISTRRNEKFYILKISKTF